MTCARSYLLTSEQSRGLPDPESAQVGRNTLSASEPSMSNTVITFNEGRCWCGVLPLLEQRKDDAHTHTAWEWGHWRPYPKDGQRSVVDKEKEEQKDRFNVTPWNRPMAHHKSLKLSTQKTKWCEAWYYIYSWFICVGECFWSVSSMLSK